MQREKGVKMMKKRMQKIIAIVLCSVLCAAFTSGCAGEQPSASGSNQAEPAAETAGDRAQTSRETEAEGSAAQTDGNSAGDAAGTTETLMGDSDQVGEFSMQEIGGEVYTQEMFADYDVTMVNIFTTWCTPCINEIPDLEKLRNEMADQGVNVVGIVLDAIDNYGNVDGGAVEKAGILADQTGVTYPFLIPDDTFLNGRLYGIEAVPETFFVNREGAVIGESYTGSRSLEEWKAIVEEKLADVGGAAE